MLRMFCYSLLLAALPVAIARGAETKKDKDFKSMHVTISKIDSKNHTLSVKTMDENGKEHEQSLQLSNDVKYLNSAGKDAKADSFKTGDDVCVMEKDGKVTRCAKRPKRRSRKSIAKPARLPSR